MQPTPGHDLNLKLRSPPDNRDTIEVGKSNLWVPIAGQLDEDEDAGLRSGIDIHSTSAAMTPVSLIPQPS